MKNGNSENKRNFSWIDMFFYLYPFIMIGAYFVGYKTLFYIFVIPILIVAGLGLITNLKYSNWKVAVIPVISLLIFSEIAYLITKDIFDGFCMGCYLSLAVGAIVGIIKKIRRNKDATE